MCGFSLQCMFCKFACVCKFILQLQINIYIVHVYINMYTWVRIPPEAAHFSLEKKSLSRVVLCCIVLLCIYSIHVCCLV